MQGLCFPGSPQLVLDEVTVEGIKVLGHFLWSFAVLGSLSATTFLLACRPCCRAVAAAKKHAAAAGKGCAGDPQSLIGQRALRQIAAAWLTLEVMGLAEDVVRRLPCSRFDAPVRRTSGTATPFSRLSCIHPDMSTCTAVRKTSSQPPTLRAHAGL